MTELNESVPSPFGFGLQPSFKSLESSLRHRAPTSDIKRRGRSPLDRAIEDEIISRLVMAHGKALAPNVTPPEKFIPGVADFTELVLGAQKTQAADYIHACRERGASLERIYLEVLAPSALHLRKLWMDDERDFADVTLALWRLQQLLREFSPAFCAGAEHEAVGLSALLSPAPGQSNDIGYMMFGLTLAGEFLRRDGWTTWIEPDPMNTGFAETIRTQWFDVVEFFANSDRKLDELATTIKMVRRESSNRDVGIMVCGPAFKERPELLRLVGGDAIVSDLSKEALQARNVVHQLTDRK